MIHLFKKSLILLMMLLINIHLYGQKRVHRVHHHGRHGKVVVVKRSPYRPHRVRVYHPAWHPAFSYNRRWVFFPKYNLYWDNWRNHYRFWNGTIWISQPTPPPVIVNVNLNQEKHYELKEQDDDKDSIDTENDIHKSEYKPD